MSTVSDDIIVARWPHLVFGESGVFRLAEVAHFLEDLEVAHHAHASEIRAEFIQRLDYLSGYGGAVSESDVRQRYRVHLEKDWAPHSFSLVWKALNKNSGTYEYAFNGGLIWHGGPADPLCIALSPMWFGIHT